MIVSLRCDCAFFLEKLEIIMCRLWRPECVARHPDTSNAQRFFLIFERMNVRLSYPRISSFTAASSSAVGLVCFQLIVCPSFSYLGIRWIWK